MYSYLQSKTLIKEKVEKQGGSSIMSQNTSPSLTMNTQLNLNITEWLDKDSLEEFSERRLIFVINNLHSQVWCYV